MIRSSWPTERSARKANTPIAGSRRRRPPAARHLLVDQAAAPVGERRRSRGRDDLRGDGRDRHRRRDAGEDQQRRQQKPAADAEHARNKTDRCAHAQERGTCSPSARRSGGKAAPAAPVGMSSRCGGPAANKRRRGGAVKSRSPAEEPALPLRSTSGRSGLKRGDELGVDLDRSSAGRLCLGTPRSRRSSSVREARRPAPDRSRYRRGASAQARPAR